MQAVAGDLERQNAPAIVADSSRDPAGDTLLHQEDHAASAPRATRFGGPSALPGGDTDQLVDERRRDSRGVAAAQLPLLAEQARHLVPPGVSQRLVHGAGD